jgi:predicted ATPase
MTRVLITGMSGTGKSSVPAKLARRGHRVVDADHGYAVEVASADGGTEQRWDEEWMALLGDDHAFARVMPSTA